MNFKALRDSYLEEAQEELKDAISELEGSRLIMFSRVMERVVLWKARVEFLTGLEELDPEATIAKLQNNYFQHASDRSYPLRNEIDRGVIEDQINLIKEMK